MCSPVPSGQVLPRQAPFSDGKRRMLHTKGWKWSVVLLLAALLAAGLLARRDDKLRDDVLQQLLLAEPETIDEEGLMFTSIAWEDERTTRAVVRRDPDTAEETVIAAFTYAAKPAQDSEYYFQAGELVRETFSSDYSRMAVTKCFTGTTERHAGWLDTEGNFFDVTKTLGRRASGHYGGPVECYALGFAGCWFGYCQHIPDSTFYMDFFVPVDMVKPGAVQESTLKMLVPAGPDGNPIPAERNDVYAPWRTADWLDGMRRSE